MTRVTPQQAGTPRAINKVLTGLVVRPHLLRLFQVNVRFSMSVQESSSLCLIMSTLSKIGGGGVTGTLELREVRVAGTGRRTGCPCISSVLGSSFPIVGPGVGL